MRRCPIVVGIIGGIASGKSAVANRLVERGAAHISADELGHSLLLDDAMIRNAVVELLGPTILNASTGIDRKKIAAMVFGNDRLSRQRLRDLEAILHPAIRRLAESRLAELRRQAMIPVIALDAPLLIEAGWACLCDEIIFVDTPFELRKQLAAKRGWTVDELNRREAAQLSLAEKRTAATQVVVNDGDLDKLHRKIDVLYDALSRME